MDSKELEKRTQERLNKIFSKKELKEDTKVKQQYLTYSKQEKQRGKKPSTYANWLRAQRSGLSRPEQKQMRGLSGADAEAVEKMLRGK